MSVDPWIIQPDNFNKKKYDDLLLFFISLITNSLFIYVRVMTNDSNDGCYDS